MPVLHYKPVIGGFEIFIQNLAEKLSQKMPVWVITGRVKGTAFKEKNNGLEIIRTSPFILKNLSYTSKAYRLSALVFIFFKSWRLVKKEKINLLHCHGFFSGLVGLVLKKLTKVPYLITIQSADLNVYHPRLEKRFWRFVRFRKLLWWLEKEIYTNAFKCHSVSQYLSDYYGDFGIKDSVVIPNGVDQEMFRSIKDNKDAVMGLRQKINKKHNLNLKPETKILVNVSRLEKKNGVDVLIRALPRLNIGDYVLLLIGNGSERKYLEDLVKENNLNDKVRFLGDMVNTEVPEYLQAADLFVRIPLAEGFGIVYIEAMACGTPIIATPVGGITDIIPLDKRAEMISRVNDSQDTADRINNFFKDLNLTRNLSEWGLASVKAKYNWQNIVEEIIMIYLEPRLVIATGIFPPDIGGPATYSNNLLNELPKLGFNVKLISYTDNPELGQDSRITRISRQKNILFRYLGYYFKLKKLAKNAQLIYAQCPLGSGWPTSWVSQKLNKPYIIKITGDYAWEQAQYQFGIKDSLDEFQNRGYGGKIERIRRIRNKVVKGAKLVVAPSEYLKKIVIGWGIDESQIKVIYNSFSPLSPSGKKIEIEGDLILSIGRLAPWKGFLALIDILPELLKINPNFKLAIVGEGDDRKPLEDRIEALGLKDKVILTGKLKASELMDYYQEAKILVLNTAYEGLSHILLEAQAAGLPIAASNVGGNPEVIANGQNGLLFEYNNKEEIKKAILTICQDKALAEKFKEAGLIRSRDFSFDRMIAETAKTLKENV